MNMPSLMDRLLMCYCFTCVSVYGLGPGTHHSTSPSFNDSSIGGDVVIHSAFNEGSDVNLTCSNKTWNETLYVIWTIQLKYRNECKISLDDGGRRVDTCKDGKSLYTSSTQSYLHIPNLTNGDEGVYKCESVYEGGIDRYEINVAITVPPRISAWLEKEDNKMVAMCKAERGKPAANIFWSHEGNLSDVKTSSDKDGFFTVESRLEISEGTNTENLNCAVSHPYWREDKILEPKLTKGQIFQRALDKRKALNLGLKQLLGVLYYISYDNFVNIWELQYIINKSLIITLSLQVIFGHVSLLLCQSW
ncbi:cell surface glycoprotein CD200 receptor 1-like isoform X2 [Sparus aurata]|uniref:cell surface glycoprotein CD200 receptor 1-like isoform X2 n=1 Tax=Sparus aurata TaxID=8175 RepID=UPI0011C1A78C|nr:cell surface glycoprotein CD200 receptor 1-like isoform X2 [Sparus aurata]